MLWQKTRFILDTTTPVLEVIKIEIAPKIYTSKYNFKKQIFNRNSLCEDELYPIKIANIFNCLKANPITILQLDHPLY